LQLKQSAWEALDRQAETKKQLESTPPGDSQARDWEAYWDRHAYWATYLGLVFEAADGLQQGRATLQPFAARLAGARNRQKILHTRYRPEDATPLRLSSYNERKRIIETAAACAFFRDVARYDAATGAVLSEDVAEAQ
jgi:hypothetical protein